MIFSTSEPAQYVVVWPTSCKVKDIIVYRNNRNTVKFANCRSFSRKSSILLSAIFNGKYQLSLKILKT